MDDRSDERFLLVGGGIAALAAAVFLIRDGGVHGDRIRILEAGDRPGGALQPGQVPRHPALYLGNAIRGMDEQASACMEDLLGSVPTLRDPRTSLLDDVRAAAQETPIEAKGRLIGADGRVLRPSLSLDPSERAAVTALLDRPDAELAGQRIDQVLPAELFSSDFWILWTTTFRLRPGSSALDLKNSLRRHLRDLQSLPALGGLRRTRRSVYESIVRPLHQWLQRQGVAFTLGSTVTDLGTERDAAGRLRARSLTFTSRGKTYSADLGAHERVLVTLGSMTANAAYGDNTRPPEPELAHRDPAWSLWDSLAHRSSSLGRPEQFISRVADTEWLAFTINASTSDLTWHISHLTGNREGTGGLITFRDSPWLLTLAVPRQPHFTGQTPQVYTAVGYGQRLEAQGEYVDTSMLRANGRQLIEELIGQLGLERRAATVRAVTDVRSVLLPYAASPLLPRAPGDRPQVAPADAVNFGFLGQYVEIPGEVAFSMEYSVRSAMRAVHGLLGIDRPEPDNATGIDPRAGRAVLDAAAALV